MTFRRKNFFEIKIKKERKTKVQILRFLNPHRGTDTAIVIAIIGSAPAQDGLANAAVPIGARHIARSRKICAYLIR